MLNGSFISVRLRNTFSHPFTRVKMPAGVIFVVYIPSSNYEHILRFGKPKDLIPVEDTALKPARLAVELRNKKSRSIPIHLTQQYYNEGYSQPLENIEECDEVFTMENVSEFYSGCQIYFRIVIVLQ